MGEEGIYVEKALTLMFVEALDINSAKSSPKSFLFIGRNYYSRYAISTHTSRTHLSPPVTTCSTFLIGTIAQMQPWRPNMRNKCDSDD